MGKHEGGEGVLMRKSRRFGVPEGRKDVKREGGNTLGTFWKDKVREKGKRSD